MTGVKKQVASPDFTDAIGTHGFTYGLPAPSSNTPLVTMISIAAPAVVYGVSLTVVVTVTASSGTPSPNCLLSPA